MMNTITYVIIQSFSTDETRENRKFELIQRMRSYRTFMENNLDDDEIILFIMGKIIEIKEQLHNEFFMDWEEIDELFVRL